MKVVIEMSLPNYDHFVDRCDPSSRDYAVLKNGLIVRRQKEDHFERIVEVYCSLPEAKGLLDLAKRAYPGAVPAIEKAIASSRI
jgi:hypothetical protein